MSHPPIPERDHEKIGSRSIQDLAGQHFRVPGYQRGYRWGQEEVEALLKDLYDFLGEPTRDPSSYYCLQPLVVKRLENSTQAGWEVVDGQQRLTTLCLILQCLTSESPFQISYETRKGSEEFLRAPNPEAAEAFIDYHFIWHAHATIQNWLKGKSVDRPHFASGIGSAVRIIWYPLATTDNSVAVFTRLNAGKIPLTDSELIRALLLRSGQSGRLEMALEWDLMERKLQHDNFWFFLQPAGVDRPNRIELIFELMAPGTKDVDERATFHFMNEKIVATDAETVWREVKRTFETLEDWYQNRILYHLTGFLLVQDRSIRQLLELQRQFETRSEFRKALIARIGERLHGQEDLTSFITRLTYADSKTRSTLLLFNLVSILENEGSTLWFAFDRFKEEQWHLEHIHSQASEMPNDEGTQRQWLEMASQYLQKQSDLNGLIEAQLGQTAWNSGDFSKVYNAVLNEYEDEPDADDDLHRIGNLTLLDQGTNTSYKNAPFPEKRRRILGLESAGKFVPPITRNVFLKAYSAAADAPLKWTNSDRASYQQAVVKALTTFFAGPAYLSK